MNLTQAADLTVQREDQVIQAAEESARQTVRATGAEAHGGIPDALAYIQSYHKIRAWVGLAGWTLPLILIFGWGFAVHRWGILTGQLDAQGSLSAYFHTGMRDFFVSILAVVGVLLVTYKLSHEAPDNRIGTVAGVLAIGVAFFPTASDRKDHTEADLTAIQRVLGERPTQVIHFVCAIAFILLLARICLFFAELELAKKRNKSEGENQTLSSENWSRLHRLAARIIYIALAFAIVFQALDYAHEGSIITIGEGSSVLQFLKDYSILLGEAVAVFAFGMSWFVKGLDRRVLRARKAGQGERQLKSNDAPTAAIEPTPKTANRSGQ